MAEKRKRTANTPLGPLGYIPGSVPRAPPTMGNTSQFGRVDDQAVRKELANMIVLHKYPLSIVNHEGFQKFVRCLNPHFKMVSRTQAREDILIAYFGEKSESQRELRDNASRIAVSMDLWATHDEKRQFVAAAVHYIDDFWTLHNYFIEFPKLPFGCNENLQLETYLECLHNWNLDDKLSTLTIDDCFDDKFLKDTFSSRFYCPNLMLGGKFLRMRCFTRTLKSLVEEALDTLGDAMIKIQDGVAYWTATTQRQIKFACLARELGVPNGKDLPSYCENQWDSIYLMLERALLFRYVFKHEKLSDSGYTCIPSEEDWNLAKEICEVLKVFYEAAMFFSEKKYHTANEYFQKVCEIKLAISQWVSSEVEVITAMASNMMDKFDEYWNEVNTILAITAILDPRFKMYIVEYYFTKIYKDGAQGEIDRVRKVCIELFEQYRIGPRIKNASKRVKSNQSQQGINRYVKQDPMSAFDLFVTERKKETITTELDYYLDEEVLPRRDDFKLLSWWKNNGLKYPTLQMIARDVLPIPVSKVTSCAAFCRGGNVLVQHFNKLCCGTIEALMCQRNWLTVAYPGEPAIILLPISSKLRDSSWRLSMTIDEGNAQ
ncbi:hypothetical protein KSS87_013910 [Heliosperma pusillum]|nr:hypothetical protein KSS87_022413 [Heliosperma pusillum]KAH9619001.1 hypothetical protein KSS87_013910 [Heliosperma pusillum]